MNRLLYLAICLVLVSPLQAADLEEKRALEHEDYALWNTLRSQSISNDGKWISYVIQPGDGDSTLVIREAASNREYRVKRGRGARFTYDSALVLYTVAPDSEQIKKLKKDKVDSKLHPKEHLEILRLATGSTQRVERVSRFSLPDKAAGHVAFTLTGDDNPSETKTSDSELGTTYEISEEGIQRRSSRPESKKRKSSSKKESEREESKQTDPKEEASSKQEKELEALAKKREDKKRKEKRLGRTLVLRDLHSNAERRFPNVDQYRFNESGTLLAFASTSHDGSGDGVAVLELGSGEVRQIMKAVGSYGAINFSKDGKQLAFLSNVDSYEDETPDWELYHWRSGQRSARKVVAADAQGIPEKWGISGNSSPSFTEDGRRILFRTRPDREDDEDEQEDDEKEEVAKLDLWHWQDPFLQPQQLLQVQRDRNRSYQALYDLRSKKVVQLGTLEVPDVFVDPRSSSSVALGVAPDKYNKMRSWDIQGFSDWYLINLKTGERRLLAEMRRGSPSLSPEGKYVIWWDGEELTWFAIDVEDEENELINLGDMVEYPLHNELHDQPSLPSPYGIAGWLADDEAVLVYDRWDIWVVDPSQEAESYCLTADSGRETETRFRATRLDSEQRFVDLEKPQVLSALEHATKASGYYRLHVGSEDADEATSLEPLIMLDESVGGLRKAKLSQAVMFSRSTFARCPDLWSSDLDFKTTRRISRINPQQDDYLWGTAELTHWESDDGRELDGLLYKPEGFDPSKKYPLLVYFYERNSDNLHSYYAPAAGRSIINFSFYVSRGYVLFVPDIPYTVGEPGPSAANAVLPGVKSIVEKGYIDEERIGMQGHSWGGYQTAYLVTVTDMFAAAESGAPVSNMTSAYGGIRWGSGMSRMFQYEKTQSRIGGTLWEARDKYIANSPLFFADKVNTPLLILHNDQDTAVPWYQGIELFVALRRLEKPAWMLNYNGDPHWVMSDANRMDFAKRMQQFFDHYLEGDPMPVWMEKGIPAVDKGKEFGFEFVEEVEQASEEGEVESETTAATK